MAETALDEVEPAPDVNAGEGEVEDNDTQSSTEDTGDTEVADTQVEDSDVQGGENEEARGEQKSDEPEAPENQPDVKIKADDLRDYLNYYSRKWQADNPASEEQPAAPQDSAASEQQSPALSAKSTEPFQLTDEQWEAAHESREGMEAVLTAHRDAVANQLLAVFNEEAQKVQAQAKEREGQAIPGLLRTARALAKIDRFIEHPDNTKIQGYDDDVYEAYMEQAIRELPNASTDDRLKRMGELIRAGIHMRELYEANLKKGYDARPNRKAAADKPKTGGNVPKPRQKKEEPLWGSHLMMSE